MDPTIKRCIENSIRQAASTISGVDEPSPKSLGELELVPGPEYYSRETEELLLSRGRTY